LDETTLRIPARIRSAGVLACATEGGATWNYKWRVVNNRLNHYVCTMSTVVEIEAAWDNQIDDDIASGRLDILWEKARTDIVAGRVKPLDEIINDQ